MTFSLLVTCPKGLEYLLEEEVQTLGLSATRVSPQGVYGTGSLETIYTLCLWSRIANRVLLVLAEGLVLDQQALHALCYQIPWQTHFQLPTSLAIHFQGTSLNIRSTMFGAQVIKDALVDYCRAHHLERPNIDKKHAQVRLRAYLHKDMLKVCLDLTGYSLHQRGYRSIAGEAPLKENVAAALLMRAKWPTLLAQDYALCDPFCGSGTLVIEAAMMAARIAPGLLRRDQNFQYWLAHDLKLWEHCRSQAQEQQMIPKQLFSGTDKDRHAIAMAMANAEHVGVGPFIQWAVEDIKSYPVTQIAARGLFISNPPYGERLGEVEELKPIYQAMGQIFHQFPGWQAAVLTSNIELAKAIGLRAHKHYKIYNGPLECQLYCIELTDTNRLRSSPSLPMRSEGAQMFANRLKKNVTHLQKWAKRHHIECYRVYDADLPEYAYAIDIYKDHAVLQEYSPPASIPTQVAELRRQEVISVVPEVLNLKPEHVIVKQRLRQRGEQQYEKMATERQLLNVMEGRALLQVNLRDYLDTGLFLDHRLLRLRFATLKPGTRFLNCFCYTGTASVHAALAGAWTTNVDLSNTYLSWAQDNFRLNHLNVAKHEFVQADCLEWLQRSTERFDVIFLDPPSFSNSKRMNSILDIARDHEQLIRDAMRLLAPQGILYFSTNFQKFKLAENINQEFNVRNITPETIDLDFKRHPKIHYCCTIQA